MRVNHKIYGKPFSTVILECALIKTTKRITFEIVQQHCGVTNGDENGSLYFKASNGYEIISEHRMDIQSRRIWLLGASSDGPAERSGSMVTPTQEMCDDSFMGFQTALQEWAYHHQGQVLVAEIDCV